MPFKLPFQWLVLTGCLALALYFLVAKDRDWEKKVAHLSLSPVEVAQMLSPGLQRNTFPEELTSTDGKFSWKATYTIDADLQRKVENLFERYRPDYGALVALDPSTGRVLALWSYEDKAPLVPENLALQARFPAASVFKIVTASAAIDRDQIDPDFEISFGGREHTLYKRQVLRQEPNRWDRKVTLKDAFARSINTVFGKIGAFWLGPSSLKEYAGRFFFNRVLPGHLPAQAGQVGWFYEDNPFATAELASGFNRFASLSPIQGALMAASLAHDGQVYAPWLVQTLVDPQGKTVFEGRPEKRPDVLRPESARLMRELMQETVRSGTSRQSFRTWLKSRRAPVGLEVGGKTGSLQGDLGKCDWFVGYGADGGKSLAIAVLTIHGAWWRVKSSYLAREVLEAYFRRPR